MNGRIYIVVGHNFFVFLMNSNNPDYQDEILDSI